MQHLLVERGDTIEVDDVWAITFYKTEQLVLTETKETRLSDSCDLSTTVPRNISTLPVRSIICEY